MTARPQRRSALVRLLSAVTSREPGSRRHPPVPRRLLRWLGRDPDRAEWTVECHQCGQWAWVNLLRLGPRRARYWCQRCGAVVTFAELAELRRVAALRDQPAAPPPAPAATGETEAALREVMPAAMVRWVQARSRRPVMLDRLDKSTMYQLYRGWDARLIELGPAGAAELMVGDEPPPRTGLPPFSAVVGALHDACYRVDLAAQSLLESERPAPDGWTEAVWQRAEHARRWLGLRGAALCWVHSRLPPGGPATPDPAAVKAAITALRSGSRPDAAASRAARAALFGTDGGPALATLLRAYPAEQVLAALERYLAAGERPLREDVLARLDAPPAPATGLPRCP